MNSRRSRYEGQQAWRPPPPRDAAPLARVDAQLLSRIEGQHDTVDKTANAFRLAREVGHLVTPAMVCGHVPDCFAIAISCVQIDADPLRGEVYPQKGKRDAYSLTKVSLERLANALGVSWIPELTRAIDEHENYSRFHAACIVKNFDTTPQIKTATKTIDLRDGSALLAQMRAEARDDADPEQRIRMARVHITRMCETKAKLAAIRSFGLKSSYTRDELSKPFFAVQLQLTGRSADPVLQREMSAMIVRSALEGGARMLYGRAPTLPALPPPAPPPPVGTKTDDEDDEGFYEPIDLSRDVVQTPANSGARPPVKTHAPATTRKAAPLGQQSGVIVPHRKGTPAVAIEDADDDVLVRWVERIGRDLDEGKSFTPDRDRATREAMIAELKFRASREDPIKDPDPLADGWR